MKGLDTEIDFVGIVDMLPPQERKSWDIAGALSKFLAGMGVDQKCKECATNEEVFAVLRKFREMSKNSALMLHFVSHGNADGIAIKDSAEPLIRWKDLRCFLLDLNHQLGEQVEQTSVSPEWRLDKT